MPNYSASQLSRLISRYTREHSSYKYWHALSLPETPHLYDLTLYWHIIGYDDNLQIVHCPLISFTETSSLSEQPLMRLLERLYFPIQELLTRKELHSELDNSSTSTSVPEGEQLSAISCSPASFVFQAWIGEERTHLQNVLNHTYEFYEQLKEAAKARGMTAVLA